MIILCTCFPDSVDMKTKRKAFDLVMAIRRLERGAEALAVSVHPDRLIKPTLLLPFHRHLEQYVQLYSVMLDVRMDFLMQALSFFIYMCLRWTFGSGGRSHEGSSEHHSEKGEESRQHDGACKALLRRSLARGQFRHKRRL